MLKSLEFFAYPSLNLFCHSFYSKYCFIVVLYYCVCSSFFRYYLVIVVCYYICFSCSYYCFVVVIYYCVCSSCSGYCLAMLLSTIAFASLTPDIVSPCHYCLLLPYFVVVVCYYVCSFCSKYCFNFLLLSLVIFAPLAPSIASPYYYCLLLPCFIVVAYYYIWSSCLGITLRYHCCLLLCLLFLLRVLPCLIFVCCYVRSFSFRYCLVLLLLFATTFAFLTPGIALLCCHCLLLYLLFLLWLLLCIIDIVCCYICFSYSGYFFALSLLSTTIFLSLTPSIILPCCCHLLFCLLLLLQVLPCLIIVICCYVCFSCSGYCLISSLSFAAMFAFFTLCIALLSLSWPLEGRGRILSHYPTRRNYWLRRFRLESKVNSIAMTSPCWLLGIEMPISLFLQLYYYFPRQVRRFLRISIR